MTHQMSSRARADIAAHLQVHGARNWTMVRGQYRSIPHATWWRLVRRVKEEAGLGHLIVARRDFTARPPAARRRANGVEVDLLAALNGLFADAAQLRSHCLDSDGRLMNPVIFDRAIRTRLKLLKQAVKLRQQILSVTAQQRFYEALVFEIAAESPETCRRLITRLRDFNREYDGGRQVPGERR